jgi:DNA-binding transcriptional LysR family regulator
MSMELSQLRYFVAVAEAGSMLRAAAIDVAIGATLLGVADDFHSLNLFELPRGAVISAHHLLSKAGDLSFEDLLSYPLVGYSRRT